MGARLLVVDDDHDVRTLFRAMLCDTGEYEVDVAGGGEEALRLYTVARDMGRPYDLIILDLAMPFTNGFDVEDAIWRSGDHTTKVAFLSGSDDPFPAHRQNFTRSVARWLKPVDCAMLRDLVQRALVEGAGD